MEDINWVTHSTLIVLGRLKFYFFQLKECISANSTSSHHLNWQDGKISSFLPLSDDYRWLLSNSTSGISLNCLNRNVCREDGTAEDRRHGGERLSAKIYDV
jgi:hypothetical protein